MESRVFKTLRVTLELYWTILVLSIIVQRGVPDRLLYQVVSVYVLFGLSVVCRVVLSGRLRSRGLTSVDSRNENKDPVVSGIFFRGLLSDSIIGQTLSCRL